MNPLNWDTLLLTQDLVGTDLQLIDQNTGLIHRGPIVAITLSAETVRFDLGWSAFLHLFSGGVWERSSKTHISIPRGVLPKVEEDGSLVFEEYEVLNMSIFPKGQNLAMSEVKGFDPIN